MEGAGAGEHWLPGGPLLKTWTQASQGAWLGVLVSLHNQHILAVRDLISRHLRLGFLFVCFLLSKLGV